MLLKARLLHEYRKEIPYGDTPDGLMRAINFNIGKNRESAEKGERLRCACGASEGELHELGCEREHCPFCGGQLVSCGCDVELLKASNRVPFIDYATMCSKCGQLYPSFFKVPNDEWQRYIQKDMQNAVICHECYDYIKKVIDANAQKRLDGDALAEGEGKAD